MQPAKGRDDQPDEQQAGLDSLLVQLGNPRIALVHIVLDRNANVDFLAGRDRLEPFLELARRKHHAIGNLGIVDLVLAEKQTVFAFLIIA